ncbi:hypothetical protein EKPJFOCH_1743 [Methylobacterium thuringiense]|uniref:Uncharacterized protein n=1 Tax=Methylobacterium thuringiense TaxID=1003091 RepID=A0ABQ4TK99_9HYPH|nr:hypothetical protein EKPJFOCH_1743 [Methylobacterium thuringiense]
MSETRTLVDRLRGKYRVAIRDGLGPAGGEEPDNPDEFVRTFQTSPIQHEAAAEIERLREALAVIAGGDGDPAIIAQQTLDGTEGG